MMDYVNLRMLSLYEKIFNYAKPGAENDPVFIEGKQCYEKLKKDVAENAREHFEVLEECCADVTEPPWCGFSDDGKSVAIMAAGRPFDVFQFEEPPKEADVHYLLLSQPHVIKAMIERIRKLEIQANLDPPEERWTRDFKEKSDECWKSDASELAE